MIKPDYKYMHVILNQCLRLHLGHSLAAAALYCLLLLGVRSLCLLPLLAGLPPWGIALTAVLLAPVVGIFSCRLGYGLMVLTARLLEKKYVTLGYILIGFLKRSSAAASRLDKAGYADGAAFLCRTGLCVLGICLSYGRFPPQFAPVPFVWAVLGCLCLSSLLSALWGIPFSYFFLILYDKPELAGRQAVRTGLSYTFGRFFHLLGFLLYAGGMDIVLLAVTLLLFCLFPKALLLQPSFRLMVAMLGMSCLLSALKVLVRFCFAFVIYYYSLTGVLHIHRTEEEA